MSRRTRILLIVIPAACVLLVAADFAARAVVESAMADSMRRRTEASGAQVSVQALSMLVALATGRVPGVSIRLEEPRGDGVEFESLALDLRDVELRLTGGGAREISGSSGDAVLRITEDQLNGSVAERTLGLVRIDLTQNGLVATVDVPGVGSASATARIDVRSGDLVVDLQELRVGERTVEVPAGVPSPRFPIPNLPPGSDLEAFLVVGETLELRLAIGPFRAVDGDFAATAAD